MIMDNGIGGKLHYFQISECDAQRPCQQGQWINCFPYAWHPSCQTNIGGGERALKEVPQDQANNFQSSQRGEF